MGSSSRPSRTIASLRRIARIVTLPSASRTSTAGGTGSVTACADAGRPARIASTSERTIRECKGASPALYPGQLFLRAVADFRDLGLEVGGETLPVFSEFRLERLMLRTIERPPHGGCVQNVALGHLRRIDAAELGDRFLLLVGQRHLFAAGVGVLLAQALHCQFVRRLHVSHDTQLPTTKLPPPKPPNYPATQPPKYPATYCVSTAVSLPPSENSHTLSPR